MEKKVGNSIYFLQGELSNKFISKFIHDGHTFEHAEQAFMWEKAVFFGDEKTADLILKRSNPKVIYDLGKSIEGYDEERWNNARYFIMCSILSSKFSFSEQLKEVLVNTKDNKLVYSDPYNDVWGAGLHWKDSLILDESNWKGLNLLGKALEQVRTDISNNKYNKTYTATTTDVVTNKSKEPKKKKDIWDYTYALFGALGIVALANAILLAVKKD